MGLTGILLAQDFDLTVDCLPGTYSETNPKKYEPITVRATPLILFPAVVEHRIYCQAGEYITQRLASLYHK